MCDYNMDYKDLQDRRFRDGGLKRGGEVERNNRVALLSTKRKLKEIPSDITFDDEEEMLKEIS